MSVKTIAKAAFGGLIILFSSQVFSAASDLNVKSIDIPAFNLISDTLDKIIAENGGRNDFVMQQICALARGEKNQQDVNTVLKANNIEVSTIPERGTLASLMVNGNKPEQAYACATYVATAIFQPIDNAVLYDKTKNDKGLLTAKLNSEKFIADTRLKMSMAQATAQLYAVIVSNLPVNNDATLADYQLSVARTIYNYAPDYLRLLRVLYLSDKAKYTPGTITKSTISVADNQGQELQISPRGTVLMSKGVVWLGNGKILGKEYFVPVKIIASPQAGPVSETVPVPNKKVKKGKDKK